MTAPGPGGSAERRVTCPHCRGPAVFALSNPSRPFCSERCRNGDLGDWANERFRVPAEAPTDDDPRPPEGH
jgi:endogenous inhibitor of DNA gyrase (YacG/DUF329 family)